MNPFKPYLPIFPFVVNRTNLWGKFDPVTYHQFGFTRHNGVDVAIAPDELIHAPFDGTVYQNGNQPNGGGIYCGFLSKDTFDFPAFECVTPDGIKIGFTQGRYRVLMDFLHLKSISAQVGQEYKVGDVLAVQDNTGFTTGPHTHIQPRRVTYDGKSITFVDINDAHGSFDPTKFWENISASSVPALDQMIKQTGSVVSAITQAPIPVADKFSLLDSIKKVAQALANLFK